MFFSVKHQKNHQENWATRLCGVSTPIFALVKKTTFTPKLASEERGLLKDFFAISLYIYKLYCTSTEEFAHVGGFGLHGNWQKWNKGRLVGMCRHTFREAIMSTPTAKKRCYVCDVGFQDF